MRSLATLGVMLALQGSVRAEERAAAREAEAHFVAGSRLFSVKKYEQAAAEFQRGHELAPRPLFQYDIGECYYWLGDSVRALAAFESFLATAPANDRHRATAQKRAATLRKKLAHAPPPPPPETGTTTGTGTTTTTTTTPATQPPPEPTSPLARLEPPPSTVAVPPPANPLAPPAPRSRRPLIIGVVIAVGAAVIAGAVAAAVTLTPRSPPRVDDGYTPVPLR